MGSWTNREMMLILQGHTTLHQQTSGKTGKRISHTTLIWKGLSFPSCLCWQQQSWCTIAGWRVRSVNLYTGRKYEANTQAHVKITSGSTSLASYTCFRIFKPGIDTILMPFLKSVLNRLQRITKAECLDPSSSSATTPWEKRTSLS